MARKRRRKRNRSKQPNNNNPRKARATNNTNPPAKRRGPMETLGHNLGAGLGAFAGKAFGSLFGSGDYHEEHAASGLDVNRNTVVQPMTAAQVPEFAEVNHLHGATMVRHREYIQDLSSNQFVGPSMITPMNSGIFPWLSAMAQNYQQWVPMGIVFEFVSTAGNAFSGGAAALGDITFATQYDAEASLLISKNEMLNSFQATSAATSQNCMHALECAPDDTPNTPLYLEQDPSFFHFPDRLTQLGMINILAAGSLTPYVIGQLWVTYEILLLKPRLVTVFKSLSVTDYCKEHKAEWEERKEVEGPTTSRFVIREKSKSVGPLRDEVLEGYIAPRGPNPGRTQPTTRVTVPSVTTNRPAPSY